MMLEETEASRKRGRVNLYEHSPHAILYEHGQVIAVFGARGRPKQENKST